MLRTSLPLPHFCVGLKQVKFCRLRLEGPKCDFWAIASSSPRVLHVLSLPWQIHLPHLSSPLCVLRDSLVYSASVGLLPSPLVHLASGEKSMRTCSIYSRAPSLLAVAVQLLKATTYVWWPSPTATAVNSLALNP